MDGSALLMGVLNPGERMVWSHQRQPIFSRSLLTRLAIVASVLWFVAFMLLHDVSLKGQQRPLWLRVELFCSAGWFFILPVFLCWFRLRSARNTAYAPTDKRLPLALGLRRKDIRAVALTALGRVEIVRRHELLLNLRRPERTFFGPKPVWTFLDTGETGKRATPYLRVDDPTSVQRLLENARNAVWYPMTDLTDLTSNAQAVGVGNTGAVSSPKVSPDDR
jgi:hypothetical protein